MRARRPCSFVNALVLGTWLGCARPEATPPSVDGPGAFAVGSVHFEVPDAAGERPLPVEAWYPAVPSAAGAAARGFPVEEFEAPGERREQLAAWMAQAPEACVPRTAHSARGAAAAAGPLPVLLLSHCFNGFRFSLHSVAERLASHGFVVVAPDHVGNTLYERTAHLDDAFLAVRAADLRRVLDVLLAPEGGGSPVELSGRLDATRVGVLGHSFGAVTAGKVVELDGRVKAGLLLAAPVDSPLLNEGGLARISRPLSWLVALEDNSITSVGNQFIRDNISKSPRPAWLVEVADAGHWSFTDISGLGGEFQAGCGSGQRDPSGAPFTYLDNGTARAVAQRYAVAWARAMVNGDEAAREALSEEVPTGTVRVRSR